MNIKPGQLVVIQDSPIRWGNPKQQIFTFKSKEYGTTNRVLPTRTLGLFLRRISNRSVWRSNPGEKFALVLFGETVECLQIEDFQKFEDL